MWTKWWFRTTNPARFRRSEGPSRRKCWWKLRALSRIWDRSTATFPRQNDYRASNTTRKLSIELRRAITPVTMRGNNTSPLRRSLSINRNYVCSCRAWCNGKKKERTLYFHDDYRLKRRKIIRDDAYWTLRGDVSLLNKKKNKRSVERACAQCQTRWKTWEVQKQRKGSVARKSPVEKI